MNTPPANHRPVVIAPTYNNARTVAQVLRRVQALGLPIIAVNDGSTDDTARVLHAWHHTGSADVTATRRVIHHPANRGKAGALITGFHHARDEGYTHAITIDTDLQHDPEDIPALLALSQADPEALVLGMRRDDLAGTPWRSLAGRRWSSRLIRWECGLRVTDSQSGLRVYPVSLAHKARCRAGRYGYETEIIVRARWLGHPVIESPITSRYLPVEESVSHFRPVTDTMRVLGIHFRLLPQSPWYRLRMPRR